MTLRTVSIFSDIIGIEWNVSGLHIEKNGIICDSSDAQLEENHVNTLQNLSITDGNRLCVTLAVFLCKTLAPVQEKRIIVFKIHLECLGAV